MACTGQDIGHGGRELRSGPDAGRQSGQGDLAEVITIRPVRSARAGFIGSLITKARVFVSPRVQATSVRSTPRPPSSPALLSVLHPGVPDDAA
jgi:hypothetical protein